MKNQMKIDKIILHNKRLQKKLRILILMTVVILMLNLKKKKRQLKKRIKTLRLRLMIKKKKTTLNKRNLEKWRQKNHKLKNHKEVLIVTADLLKKKRKKQIR